MTQTSPARLHGRVHFDHVRAPWLLYVDGTILTVRGATPQDLPGVALMHSRCSAKSLLDRYRSGGKPPAIVVLDRHVRDPLSFVVATENGRVVGTSRVVEDPTHNWGSGEVSMLIEDGWQRLGIGRRLLRHTAAAAALTGYRQLVCHPGTIGGVVHRLMAGVGTTRLIADPQKHLHTSLPDSARIGLGSLHGGVGRAALASITG